MTTAGECHCCYKAAESALSNAPCQALSHNMTSTAQLQLRINELMSELSEVQVSRSIV
jgi:hypothetical protein